MTAAAVPREERFLRGGVGDDNCRATKTRPTSVNPGKRNTADGPYLNTAALTQLLGAAKSTALARHLQPELTEGLDLALATIDPTKVTTQLILKAFEHVPGASAQLQQILGSNSEAAASLLASSLQPPIDCLIDSESSVKGGLAPGDYLVLQTPVIQATVTTEGKVTRQSVSSQMPSVEPALAAGESNAQPAAPVKPYRPEANGNVEERKSAKCHTSSPGGSTACAEHQVNTLLWEHEQSTLIAEVQALRKHKEWADKKIDQLIRRVRDAEGPQRLLKEEVQQLRLEKDSVESKLKDFERSLQKLKDCTYTEAAQRREYELSLRNAQAELRGSSLREQEVQNQLRDAQVVVRHEKKRREALERQLKKVSDERFEAQASMSQVESAAAGLAKSLEAAQQALNDQVAEMKRVQDAMLAAQQQAKAAKQRGDDLEQQLGAAQAEATSRALESEGVIAALTVQLDEAQLPSAAHEQQSSLYSHFGGPALFEGGANWLQNGDFPGLGGINSFAVNFNSIQSVSAPFGRSIPSSTTTGGRASGKSAASHARGGVEVP